MRLAVQIRLQQRPTTSVMLTVTTKTPLSMLCGTGDDSRLGPDRQRLPLTLTNRKMEILLITLPHWWQREHSCRASTAKMSS